MFRYGIFKEIIYNRDEPKIIKYTKLNEMNIMKETITNLCERILLNNGKIDGIVTFVIEGIDYLEIRLKIMKCEAGEIHVENIIELMEEIFIYHFSKNNKNNKKEEINTCLDATNEYHKNKNNTIRKK